MGHAGFTPGNNNQFQFTPNAKVLGFPWRDQCLVRGSMGTEHRLWTGPPLPSSLRNPLSHHLLRRSRSRRAGEHTDGTDVLINVRPVDALPGPDHLEVLPLR